MATRIGTSRRNRVDARPIRHSAIPRQPTGQFAFGVSYFGSLAPHRASGKDCRRGLPNGACLRLYTKRGDPSVVTGLDPKRNYAAAAS